MIVDEKELTKEWQEVSECNKNYIGQEVNYAEGQISKILVRLGPICECGNHMLLMKCFIKEYIVDKNDPNKYSKKKPAKKMLSEEETNVGIESICEECDIDDFGFFTDENLKEYDNPTPQPHRICSNCQCKFHCFSEEDLEAGLDLEDVSKACESCIECIKIEIDGNPKMANKAEIQKAIQKTE